MLRCYPQPEGYAILICDAQQYCDKAAEALAGYFLSPEGDEDWDTRWDGDESILSFTINRQGEQLRWAVHAVESALCHHITKVNHQLLLSAVKGSGNKMFFPEVCYSERSVK